jgi:D-sedoheptulose 7-phosphate isomerase
VSSFRSFADEYFGNFAAAIGALSREPLEQVVDILEGVRQRGGTVWVAGNGGSAAISDHLVCDATKGTYVPGGGPLRSVSLSSNGPMLTALANDIEYAEVFRQQLEYYLRPEDAVLVISSSGNSPNVVAACEYAREKGVPTIAFVGFDGGKLRSLADVAIWVPVRNYGICEDAHQAVMHCITQYMRARAEKVATQA